MFQHRGKWPSIPT